MKDRIDKLSLLEFNMRESELSSLDGFLVMKESDSIYNMPLFEGEMDKRKEDVTLKGNKQYNSKETDIVLKKCLGCETESIDYDKLKKFFISVFADFSFTSNYLFNKNEFKIVNLLFIRKFNRPLSKDSHKNGWLVTSSHLRNIIQTKFQRKQEECFKFILTRIYRILKKKHKKAFFQIFFGEQARNNGIDIKNYYLPSVTHPSHKNFNYTYLRSLLKSELFLSEALKVLKEEVTYLHTKEVCKKLKTKFSQWCNIEGPEVKRYSMILDSIKDKRKFILPWTFFELNYAKQLFFNFCEREFEKGYYDEREGV